MGSHATAQAAKRLGFVPPPKTLINTIRAGQAKLVAFGEQERLIYDVPFEGTTVRVVVNKELDWVVSVLPPQFGLEKRADRYKKSRKQSSNRKREFFRGFQGDE
jgi:hypothetical protein